MEKYITNQKKKQMQMFKFLPHASPVIGTNKHQRVAVEKLTSLGLSIPENNKQWYRKQSWLW